MTTTPVTNAARAALALLLGTVALTGCLDEPEIEERWTRVDILSSNVTPGTTLDGDSSSVTLRTAVTFRALRTGFLVAEVRVADSLTVDQVLVDPTADRLTVSREIDRVLAGSVTAGRATRAITGWPHLIHEMNLTFDARVAGAAFDSAGVAPTGVFLLAYLADGEEVELEDGSDSLVVTPWPTDDYEVLHTGIELSLPGEETAP